MDKLVISALFINTFVHPLTFTGELYITHEILASANNISSVFHFIYKPEVAPTSLDIGGWNWSIFDAYILYEFTRSPYYDIRSNWRYRYPLERYWDKLNWNGNHYYLRTDETISYQIRAVAYAFKIDNGIGYILYSDSGIKYFQHDIITCNISSTITEDRTCADEIDVSWTSVTPRRSTTTAPWRNDKKNTGNAPVWLWAVYCGIGMILLGCVLVCLRWQFIKRSRGNNETPSVPMPINDAPVPQREIENNTEEDRQSHLAHLTLDSERQIDVEQPHQSRMEVNQWLHPESGSFSGAGYRACARGEAAISLNRNLPPAYEEACQLYIISTETRQAQMSNPTTTEPTHVAVRKFSPQKVSIC